MKGKLILRSILLVMLVWVQALPAYTQVTILNNGKTKARIILNEDKQINQTAAHIFQKFIQKISNQTLSIVTNQPPKKGDILIGSLPPEGVTKMAFPSPPTTAFFESPAKTKV